MPLSNTDLIEVERGGVSYQATGAQLNDYITPIYNTWDPASMAANAYNISGGGKRVTLNAKTDTHKWYTIKTTLPIPNTGKWMTEFRMHKQPLSSQGSFQSGAFLGVCEKSNAAHPTTTSWYVSKNSSSRSLGSGCFSEFANSGGQFTYTEGNFNYKPWLAGYRVYVCVDRDANKMEIHQTSDNPNAYCWPVEWRDYSVLNLNLDPNKEYVFALSAQDSTYRSDGFQTDITLNSGENGWHSKDANFLGKGYRGLHNRV